MTKIPNEHKGPTRFQKRVVPGEQAAQIQESYFQSFPRMERLLSTEHPPLLAQMEATCRRLDALLKSGSPQEAARAQTPMNAYARSLELYRYLAALRDKTWAESNNEGSVNDK